MLPQSPPIRMVDRLVERNSPHRCVVLKVFSADEPLLEGMDGIPFSLVLGTLCQATAFLSPEEKPGEGRILRVDQAEMTGIVRPGDALRVTATLLEEGSPAMRAEVVGEVEGKRVARLLVLIAR